MLIRKVTIIFLVMGLLAGGDGEGVVFTFGGMNPSIPFDVLSLDIAALDLELNSPNTGNAFRLPSLHFSANYRLKSGHAISYYQ